MKNIARIIISCLLLAVVIACASGKSPGPLEGEWQMSGLVPMTVTFRDGETEAMGMIDKVSYETDGQDVLVTYLDGMAKGTTMRFTMTGPDTVHSEFGALKRIR